MRPDPQEIPLDRSEAPDPTETALRLLATREHSQHELRGKLLARGFGELAVDACIGRLAAAGQISDRRYAEVYARSRWHRGYGPFRIGQELSQKGVEQDVVASVLDLGADDWWASMRRAHDKKYGEALPADSQERRRRARFLEYRGFDAAMVRRFLWSRD